MDVALYDPVGGYYRSGRLIGSRGDFYTSPSVHPVFAALLAIQLHRMWELLERPSPFYVVEMGAAGSKLARDTTAWSGSLSKAFADALRYVALDRYRTEDSTDTDQNGLCRITSSALDVPLREITGCFLSNELVDSFPVHRFRVQGTAIEELYVALEDGTELVEVPGEPSGDLMDRLIGMEYLLSDGQEGEVRLNTSDWLAQVSRALTRGFVLTIDYGHEAETLYSRSRSRGTLQTYFAHTSDPNPFQRIGEQDITAHVDFSQIVEEGRTVGLNPVALVSQERWLKGLGFDGMLLKLRGRSLSQTDARSNMMSMLDLVRPDGLGGFKVLVQQKGTDVDSIGLLTPETQESATLDPPPLGPENVPLLEGRYPHEAWDPGTLWPFKGPDEHVSSKG